MCAVFTGNNLIKLQEIDSTNNYLALLASKEKLADGTVVIASHQTAGKGQRGNVWQSQKGMNLTFSILYNPVNININKQFLLTQAIALGVFDYLKSKCKNVKVKWPNDLFIGHKKIGGMLIENAIKGESIAQVVIGMGLNINQAVFEMPLNKATSLFLENGVKYKLDNELTDVLTYIEHRYLQWKNGHYSQLKQQYLEVLYLYHQQHQFTLPNGNLLKGKIVGVADNGQLIIEDDAGFILHFGNKEIAF